MDKKKYLNPRMLSDYIGICYAKALDFIKYSGIHYVRIGRTYYVERQTLDEYLASHRNINTDIVIDDSYLKL